VVSVVVLEVPSEWVPKMALVGFMHCHYRIGNYLTVTALGWRAMCVKR
jgi:hypothetical protein